MRKYGWFLFLFVAVSSLFPHITLADQLVADVVAPPDWLEMVLVLLQSVPYVGPLLVEVIKWVGVISAVATALSIAAQAIFTVPELVSRWAGAQGVADKLKKYSDLVLPWLRYLSMFNVQKKK